MNKLQELAELKAKVTQLETEVVPKAEAQIKAIETQINSLFTELSTICKTAGLKPDISISGNRLRYDGYDWRPGYDSDWYSSSSDC